MQTVVIAISTLLLAAVFNGQQNTAREEETIIRTAYAKLSYADEVRIILGAVLDTERDKLWKSPVNLADPALSSRLSFELSDFRFGKVSDIAERKMGEFDGISTQIGGEILNVTPSVYNYSVHGQYSGYVAYVKFAWKPSPYTIISPPEKWTVTKALADPQFEGKSYTTYATYSVTLTFAHKSRTYNSMALYGHDDKGKAQIAFLDGVADPTAIMFALDHSLYPAAFVESDLKTVPFVDKWLYDNARTCNAKSEADNGRVDVCCDTGSGRCGVSKSSLAPRSAGSRPSHPTQLLPASFNVSAALIHPVLLPQTTTPSCKQFNVSTSFPHDLANGLEHNTGAHEFNAFVSGSCTYTDGTAIPGPCNAQCSAQTSSVLTDNGSLTGIVFVHALATVDSSGGDFDNGGSTAISCQGISGGTVRSCTFPCSTTVSVTAGGKGNLSATVSFPPSQLWGDQNSGVMNCQPRDSTPTTTSCDTTDQTFTKNGTTVCEPLIVDLTGDGFHLTDSAHGVVFDILANNNPFKIPWIADSRNAFLVLDRNGNGKVDNALELFSNVAPQMPSDHPNGFLALAMYDKPEYGGNGDGVIDSKDLIFSQLRLWIDANHDGISQPGELHTLPEMGVFSISLDYSLSRRTDEFGNVFRYKARVNPGLQGSADVGPMIYDVFFVNK